MKYIFASFLLGCLIVTSCTDNSEFSERIDCTENELPERAVINRNFEDILAIPFPNQSQTQISARLLINREGEVMDAVILSETTTVIYPDCLTVEETNQQIERALRGYRYEPDPEAPMEQCISLDFIIEELDVFLGGC